MLRFGYNSCERCLAAENIGCIFPGMGLNAYFHLLAILNLNIKPSVLTNELHPSLGTENHTSEAFEYWLLIFFLGSGPNSGQSPVQWGDNLYVSLFVYPSS